MDEHQYSSESTESGKDRTRQGNDPVPNRRRFKSESPGRSAMPLIRKKRVTPLKTLPGHILFIRKMSVPFEVKSCFPFITHSDRNCDSRPIRDDIGHAVVS